jgi:hypothetical protein
VTPLSPDRYKLQLTIGGETLEKLRLAKDMLSHAIPSGDEAAVLDRALTVLVEDLARKKFADIRRPRPSSGPQPGARDPAAAVKREVWVRDLGRCAYVGPNGRRCNERRFLEFHHSTFSEARPRSIKSVSYAAVTTTTNGGCILESAARTAAHPSGSVCLRTGRESDRDQPGNVPPTGLNTFWNVLN